MSGFVKSFLGSRQPYERRTILDDSGTTWSIYGVSEGMRTTYAKDITYFDTIDAQEKAYFLGLLYADGCNMEGVGWHISLHERDKAVLERFSQVIFGMNRLRYKKPYSRPTKAGVMINAAGQYALTVASVEMSRRLAAKGLVPRKSLVLTFPSADRVPVHLINHFVRGYFDGDGCLSHRTAAHAKRYIVSILSSRAFCDHLIEIGSTLGVRFRLAKRQTKIDKVDLSGNRQIKVFMDWLYKDATIYLERKWLKYQELCADLHRMDTKPKYSRYGNITYDKTRSKWAAHARIDKRTRYVGRYETEELAYQAQQAFIEARRALPDPVSQGEGLQAGSPSPSA